MRSEINAKVLRNIPSTFTDTRIDDQIIFIEFDDGTVIPLFDPHIVSKTDMVNTIKKIAIISNFSKIEKINDKHQKGVESKYKSADTEVIEIKEPICFYGDIVSIDKNHGSVFVDLGIGILESSLSYDQKDSIQDYKIGDFVKIFGGRIDLKNIFD